MGARDKLREVVSHARERFRSHGPDSYFEYKRRRERERKQAERGRDDAERSAEREREQAEVSTPSATRPSAQPRSRRRTRLGRTRASRTESLDCPAVGS